MDTKTRPTDELLIRDPLQSWRYTQAESKRMEKDIPCKWKSKDSWSSNPHIRQNRQIKSITRDNEGPYLTTKGSIQEEDIATVNIYAPNTGAPQSTRQALTDVKGETDSTPVTAGDVHTHSHQWTDRQSSK